MKGKMQPRFFINEQGELVKRIGRAKFEVDCVVYKKNRGLFFALSNSAFKNKK